MLRAFTPHVIARACTCVNGESRGLVHGLEPCDTGPQRGGADLIAYHPSHFGDLILEVTLDTQGQSHRARGTPYACPVQADVDDAIIIDLDQLDIAAVASRHRSEAIKPRRYTVMQRPAGFRTRMGTVGHDHVIVMCRNEPTRIPGSCRGPVCAVAFKPVRLYKWRTNPGPLGTDGRRYVLV